MLAVRKRVAQFRIVCGAGYDRFGVIFWPDLLVITFLVLLIAFLRFGNLSGLVLPLWVDSVHHSAIARLILAQGGLPSSYRPFAEVDMVYYHLGYHACVALLARLSGASVETVMLVFGQCLSVCACISIGLLAAYWTGRLSAGALAMSIPGTVSLMPAYFISWGRYTQLMGLAILPLVMLLAWKAMDGGGRKSILIAGLLAGLLFYVHYRVAFFAAMFVVSYILSQLPDVVARRGLWVRYWRRAFVIAAIAIIVASPWLGRILATFVLPMDTFLQRIRGSSEYNALPLDLVTQNLNPALYGLAILGAIIGLYRRRKAALVLLIWVALLLLSVNPNLVGLGPSWIVNNFSLVISQYVPISLLAAFALSEVIALLEARLRPSLIGLLRLSVAIAVAFLAVLGATTMQNVVNPSTILATSEDTRAMQWINESTPLTALFLVNERLWQGTTYVGTDGGYWIPNLTGRQTTMPIVFYTDGDPAYVEQVNSLARVIESKPNPDDSHFLTLIRERGVTNVYIGVKGGPLPLDSFLHSPNYTLLYSAGGAYVFRLNPPS